MRHHALSRRDDDFAVLSSTKRSQAAIMVLPRGGKTGDPETTEHPQAEQWLYVISGAGEAIGPDERIALRPGSLLLIGAGEGHRIRVIGSKPLRTLSVYAPLAYRADGEALHDEVQAIGKATAKKKSPSAQGARAIGRTKPAGRDKAIARKPGRWHRLLRLGR